MCADGRGCAPIWAPESFWCPLMLEGPPLSLPARRSEPRLFERRPMNVGTLVWGCAPGPVRLGSCPVRQMDAV
jgi:hypothetical protein